MSTREENDRLYYYALYHLLTQWTAYIAILVLLLTIGFILSTAQTTTITHTKSAISALVLLWGGEIYLVVRIVRLGNFIREQLGETVNRLELLRHPQNH